VGFSVCFLSSHHKESSHPGLGAHSTAVTPTLMAATQGPHMGLGELISKTDHLNSSHTSHVQGEQVQGFCDGWP
jgi:hypothetical protein